jgi:hypothetical protein
MWILIWVVLSTFVLAISAWTFLILREQKKAWEAYAKKYSLEYDKGKMMGPPFMRGVVNGRAVVFFIGQQQTNDARGVRMVTIMEINMHCGLPTAAAIGTKETEGFLSGLQMEHAYTPENAQGHWDPEYIVRTRDPKKLQDYLTPARLEAVHAILSMKNAVALWIFDERDSVIRIETNDPLRDAAKIDKIITRIMGDIDKLMPTEAEQKLAAEERERRIREEAAKQTAAPPAPPPVAAPPPEPEQPAPAVPPSAAPPRRRRPPPLKDKK